MEMQSIVHGKEQYHNLILSVCSFLPLPKQRIIDNIYVSSPVLTSLNVLFTYIIIDYYQHSILQVRI